MNIAVIGTGYVGLVTGACLADLGNHVLCMDIDAEKISILTQGKPTIYEPELEDMMQRNLGERLSFTNDLKEAVEFASVIMLAVGTPTEKNNTPDIKAVLDVCTGIARLMVSDKTIIVKSTVPIGTCRMIKEKMDKILMDRTRKEKTIEAAPLTMMHVSVASNPEFLRQGSAIADFMQPDRVVVGVDLTREPEENEEADTNFESDKTSKLLRELYSFHIDQNKPYIETNLETAEMIKYASNAFLATKISYVNELANISEKYGVDMRMVSMAMGLDPRIGDKFLNPGPGYGGSCFPKDTKALLHIGKKVGLEPSIVKAVVQVNDNQTGYVMKKIKKLLGKLDGKTITVLGLAFKPGTDDLRESPATKLIMQLVNQKATVKVYDPQAMGNFKKAVEGVKTKAEIQYFESATEACIDSECIIIMTDWQEFAELDLEAIAETVKEKIIVDARNILYPEKARAAGFNYVGIGSL